MIDNGQIVLRLAVAALLGSLVGLERERLDRAAGLRTHALVAVGAALFMLVSAFGFEDVHGVSQVVLDPSRVAAQVVSGIGFLGAGTIIVQRGSVRGLTTAASVWAVAAVGLAAGGGLYGAAAVTTVVMLLILAGVKPIEQRLAVNRRGTIHLIVDSRTTSLAAIRLAVEDAGGYLDKVSVLPGEDGADRMELFLRGVKADNYLAIVDRLRSVGGVRQVESAVDARQRSYKITA